MLENSEAISIENEISEALSKQLDIEGVSENDIDEEFKKLENEIEIENTLNKENKEEEEEKNPLEENKEEKEEKIPLENIIEEKNEKKKILI